MKSNEILKLYREAKNTFLENKRALHFIEQSEAAFIEGHFPFAISNINIACELLKKNGKVPMCLSSIREGLYEKLSLTKRYIMKETGLKTKKR